MTELITFESIMSVHRAEKGEELSRLPPGFFESVGRWLDYKRGCRDSLSQREADTANSIVDEIVNRRQRKIVMAAIRTVRGDVPPENMTEDEKRFFDQALALFKTFKTDVMEKVSGTDFLAAEKIEEARKSLDEIRAAPPQLRPEIPQEVPQPEFRMLTDMPQFMGTDMKPYGPFKAGEKVKLPKEIAAVLVARKALEAA
ncbi:MAG: hypothetical protein QXU82_00340 [Candidatus Aenigmatarchaeota archaeon]